MACGGADDTGTATLKLAAGSTSVDDDSKIVVTTDEQQSFAFLLKVDILLNMMAGQSTPHTQWPVLREQ